jgi:hypothetical protein
MFHKKIKGLGFMKNVNNNNVRSSFNVKRRVPVFTKNRKKEFRILMTREIFETARNLKVYATPDGYLCYDNRFGERCMFTRYLMGVINPDEVVTYKNGDRTNICYDNLEVVKRSEVGSKNLKGRGNGNIKVEPGIYFLEYENRYMVSHVDSTGKHHCPRAKTLEEARAKLAKLKDLYK